MKATRTISTTELSDRLDALRGVGVSVPELRHSNDIPCYIRTDPSGVEVYWHEGRPVRVSEGQVIDDHGNVVDFAALGVRVRVLHESRLLQRVQELSMDNPYIGRDGRAYHSVEALRPADADYRAQMFQKNPTPFDLKLNTPKATCSDCGAEDEVPFKPWDLDEPFPPRKWW